MQKEKEVRKMGQKNSKGLVMSNLLYLIIFYVMYFLLVSVVKYFLDVIGSTEPLTQYYQAIPSSTKGLMDLILYVVIPIAALIFTLLASKPREAMVE